MNMKSLYRQWSPIIALLLAVAPAANAADILVPGDAPTITDAIALANAAGGDRVIITNSATYSESIDMTKPVTVLAAPGETPTIAYDAASTASFMLLMDDESVGAQFGSNEGGQIIIDGLQNANLTSLTNIQHTAGEVVIENLLLRGGKATDEHLIPQTDALAVTTARNVTFDGQGVTDFILRPDLLNGGTMNLIDCVVRNADRYGMLHSTSGGFGTVNITRSVIEGFELGIASQPGGGILNWTIEDSYIGNTTTDGSFAAIWFRAPDQVFTAHRTVFREKGIGASFFLFPGTGGTFTLDNCDIISDKDIGFRLTAGTDRTISVTDTNIFTPGSVGYFGNLTASDVVTTDYNNVLGGYDSLTSLQAITDIDPATTPTYVDIDPPGLNLGYDTPELLTADSSGGPIGSFLNGTIETVNRVLRWQLFE